MAETPIVRKTLTEYADDRAKLNAMTVPLGKTFTASGVEQDYRNTQKIDYLLGMVGHLLRRVEELEANQTPST